MESDGRVVQDLMKAWGRSRSSTVDLEGAVKEIAVTLRRYQLHEVYGDRYAAGWVRERFQAEGVHYRDPEMDKSAAYLEAEPLFAQGRVELLDHAQLVRELKNLERRARAGGRLLVDHPPRDSTTTTRTRWPLQWLSPAPAGGSRISG